MVNKFEIKHLYRRHDDNISDLEYIGGLNSDGTLWKMSIERAIKFIEDKKGTFFIVKESKELEIIINKERNSLVILINQPIELSLSGINL